MIDMDYLERNIKDSYNQKTVTIQPVRTQGSTVMFFAMLIFWSIAVVAWRMM
jgi:hypothetical protein